jgi:hypothetical protein
MSDKTTKPNPDKARDVARKPLTPSGEGSISEEELDQVSGGATAPAPAPAPPKKYLCTNE